MACGVTKTMANGAVAVCDNLGSSGHTGLHSAITTEFWFNWGRKVRVYWSTADVVAARQKPIIRGDYFSPLDENELPPPAGVLGRYYSADFNAIPDNSGLGADFQAVVGPAPRVLSGVAIPGNLGSGGNQSFVNLYQGGDNGGRTNTDDQQVTLRAVPTTRAAATNMACSLLLRCSDTWGTQAVELALFAGQSPVIIFGGSVRATGTGISTPGNKTYSFRAVGNVYTAYMDGSDTPFLTWTDNGNLVTRNSTRRRWGFSMQSNYPVFQQQYDSHGVDWITAEDYA